MARVQRMTRNMAVVACSLVCCLSMAACQGQIPKVHEKADRSTEQPVLTPEREQTIRERILQVIDKANQEYNPQELSSVMSGPALQIRTSELTIAAATGTLDPKTKIPTQVDQVVIPTDTGWPRRVYAITTTTDDQQSRRLLVLQQDSARVNYKLWAVVRLFQGARLPRFEIPTIGSRMGTLDDEGLVETPKHAVEHYVDVLNNPESAYLQQFDSDALRDNLNTLQQKVAEGMARNNGTQQQTFTADENNIAVMRSSDGGDLVVASIASEWTRSAGEGGYESHPASPDEQALFGNGTATATMKVTYANVVALYVPSSAQQEHIRAVGAERQPLTVQAL